MKPPRVALFADSFHEVNGAAHTLRHLEAYAARHGLPLLAVHSGPTTRSFTAGSVTTLELKRSPASIGVDVDFGFDPWLWRHWRRIGQGLADFQPELVHIISPGDFSVLGACWAHAMRIPVVGSYHTHLHQFAAARLDDVVRFLPAGARRTFCQWVERLFGQGLLKYYEIAALSLAPNTEIQQWLERGTGHPSRLMRRGVDIDLFHPSRRDRQGGEVVLGYVGRLVREKNLRLLVQLEQALIDSGSTDYRLVIVGHGDEREWLEKNLRRAEFKGVLRGEELARAYANFDLFAFPSRTDAFGNVVQEALASGTPVLVTDQGGPRHLVNPGVTGHVAASDREFIDRAISLVMHPEMLQSMRGAARRAACSASWEQVFAEVWESYEFCLQLVQQKHAVSREKPLAQGYLTRPACKSQFSR